MRCILAKVFFSIINSNKNFNIFSLKKIFVFIFQIDQIRAYTRDKNNILIYITHINDNTVFVILELILAIRIID